MHLQVWMITDIKLGRGSMYNPAAVPAVLMTDALHQIRSQAGEEASARAVDQFPLPCEAAGGGRLAADPNSKDEILLSERILLTKRCLCMIHRYEWVQVASATMWGYMQGASRCGNRATQQPMSNTSIWDAEESMHSSHLDC